jgi:hypothetical protein
MKLYIFSWNYFWNELFFFLDLRKVDKATLCLQVGGQRPKEKERVGGGARQKLKRNYRNKLYIWKTEKKAENLI